MSKDESCYLRQDVVDAAIDNLVSELIGSDYKEKLAEQNIDAVDFHTSLRDDIEMVFAKLSVPFCSPYQIEGNAWCFNRSCVFGATCPMRKEEP